VTTVQTQQCWAAIIKNLSVDAMRSFVYLKNLSVKATSWIEALRFEAMNRQNFFVAALKR
jgi:hypothetical protein